MSFTVQFAYTGFSLSQINNFLLCVTILIFGFCQCIGCGKMYLVVLTLDYVEQDWFERYRERVTEAEQLILTTLNFELNVQHPYTPLTSTLNKLGLSQGVLLNLALNLISEG